MLISNLNGDEGGLENIYNRLAVDLKFPEYFGKNLDALHDCLTDVDEAHIIWYESDKAKVTFGDTFVKLVKVIEDAAEKNPNIQLTLQ